MFTLRTKRKTKLTLDKTAGLYLKAGGKEIMESRKGHLVCKAKKVRLSLGLIC
jgi:hypothetical protein